MTDNKIMKMRLFICSAIGCLAITFSGCDNATLVQDAVADLPPDHIIIEPTGSSTSFLMSFADSWSVSSSSSWITCTPQSGTEGLVTITVSAALNDSGENRSGFITFSTKKESFEGISVSQESPYLKMSVEDEAGNTMVQADSVIYQWNQCRLSSFNGYILRISSNVNWKVGLEALDGHNPLNEFELSEKDGTGSKTIRLIPLTENLTDQPFDALLSLDAYMPDGERKIEAPEINNYKYNVRQKNLRFLINGSYDDVDVYLDELGTVQKTLLIDSELPWQVSSPAGWVDYRSNFELVDSLIIGSRGINPFGEERYQELVLQSDGGAFRTIRVHQERYLLEVDDEVPIGNTGGEQTISIETSGPWRLNSSSLPEWLTVSPMSGVGGKGNVERLIISCPSQNYDLTNRLADLMFESTFSQVQVTGSTSVIQDRYHLDLTVSEELRNIPTFSTEPYSLEVVCDGKWSLSADESWVSISPASGVGTTTVSVSAKSGNPNTDKDRSSVITLFSETHREKSISYTPSKGTVTQQRFIFDLEGVNSIPAVKKDGFVLAVNCSDAWIIESYPSWLNPDRTSGDRQGQVVFSITPNSDTANDRNGVIRVKSKTLGVSREFSITQEKLVFSIGTTKSFEREPVEAESVGINLRCTSDATWIVTTTSDWVNVNTWNGEGDANLGFTLDNYLDRNRDRQAMITVECQETHTRESFRITQKKFEFNVQERSFDFGEIDNSMKDLHVTCSSRWKIINQSNSSWVIFDVGEHTESSTTISVRDNTTTAARTANLRIESAVDPTIYQEVTINQDAFKFDSTPVNQNYSSYLSTPAVLNVPIICSGTWRVELPSGNGTQGIGVSRTQGTGNGDVTITVSSNPSKERRQVSVIILAERTQLRKVVTITQEGFVCTIKANSSTSDLSKSGASVSCEVSCLSSWALSSNQSWIRIGTPNGRGNGVVTLTIDKNTEKKQRTGTVTLTSEYGHTATLTITQQKK